MKFWKPIFLASSLFLTFAGVVLYSSCEKDPCVNVNCQNGGSCNNGVCKCPTGYEGPTCATASIDRFVGYYAGYTQCNEGAEVIDTVFITPYGSKNVSEVYVEQKTLPHDMLLGTVSSNETTYSLLIPDKIATNYYKKYHITLQSDNKLILDTYEQDYTTPGDTIINHCIFTGFKK